MRIASAIPLLATLALIAAGCGSDGSGSDSTAAAGLPLGAVPRCADWHRADDATRRATIEELRKFVGGEVTGRGANGVGTVLDDQTAYDTFEHYCSLPGSQSFVLYKLYGHAVGLTGIAPSGPPTAG